MASNPDEIIMPPQQVQVDQKPPVDEDEFKKQATNLRATPTGSPTRIAPSTTASVSSGASGKIDPNGEMRGIGRRGRQSKKNLTATTEGTTVTSIDWTISEDLDLTDIKTKPPPRPSVEPTYRGWKEVGCWEEKDALTLEDEAVDLLSKASIFDNYLPQVAYGDWFHNVGYIVVSGFLSWFFGWFRFTLAPVFFIMVVFSILYRSSVRRYRTVLREQAQREFSIKAIEDDYETMDWCNVFLEKFWNFLEPSVSQIVCEIANPILAESPAPAFVKQLWLDSFTVGTKPFRIDTVKTVQGTADDIVVMDWGFSFTPNALADSNNKQLKSNVNQKVIVKANVFGFPVSVAVSDVAFKGLARIRLRMMTAFPHIQTVNVTLLEPPQFDFNSKILGDTIFNWEVLAFPGLYPFINEMIKKYVGSMLFNPLSFQINLQQIMAGHPFNSAVGVLEIKVKRGSNIINFATRGNTMDPYLTFGFRKEVLAKTVHKNDTSSPAWNESYYIPVSTLSEPLNITLWDHNTRRKDRPSGSIQFDLELLIKEPKQNGLKQSFIRNNKAVGDLEFDLNFMPVIEAEHQPDGAIVPPPELNTGIARFEIIGARNLKSASKKQQPKNSDEKPPPPPNAYAELYFDNEKLITTPVVKGTPEPSWGVSHEKIVGNRAKSKVRIYIKNSGDDRILGKITSTLNELVDATQVDETWFPLARGGEVQIHSSWKPVAMVGASGAGGYTPPIGVVRISIERAEDLRNLETIGKIDPYTRVLINGFHRARTAAIESNLNPTWNEVHYATISSPNQKLTLEVMDVEAHSPDRTLGSFDVKLNEIISKNERGQFIEYVDPEKREGKLIHKKGPKGTLTYSLSFYPTLPVMTLEEIKEENEERERIIRERNEKKSKEEKEQEKKEQTDAEPTPGAARADNPKPSAASSSTKDDIIKEAYEEGRKAGSRGLGAKATVREAYEEGQRASKVDASKAKEKSKSKEEDEEELEDDDDDDDEHASSKLQLPLEELLEYKSGVFIYELIEGDISKDGVYLQAFFDNHGHHDFVTQKLKGKKPKIGVTGDAVIKELDWSKACFRLTKSKDDNRAEKALAETTIPTLQLLQNAYHEPSTVTLNGASEATFKLRCSWVPVIYEHEVPPQDSINNSGILTVDVIRAEGLLSADRNGKSDPYVELYLNTDKDSFYKTKKVKKTLEPTFNEQTTVEVANRYDSSVKVVCMDWDIGPEKDDLLGIGYVKLSDIKYNGEASEITCALEAEDGGDGGVVYLKISFKPDFVLNVRPASSTNIGDAFGTVGKGVGGIGKGVGKGVGGVGKGVGKVFKKGLGLGKGEE